MLMTMGQTGAIYAMNHISNIYMKQEQHFYTFPNCPLIDMVAPICFRSGSKKGLIPCKTVEMPAQ